MVVVSGGLRETLCKDERCMSTATVLEGCFEEVPCATLPQHLVPKEKNGSCAKFIRCLYVFYTFL